MSERPSTTSLLNAAHKGDTAAVKACLTAGVEADSCDSVGRSALFHAASVGHTDIVKALLARAADANLEDDDGETPFLAAVVGKHFAVAKLLLEAGADANMPGGRLGQVPLHWAFNMDLREETSARVIWLLEHGANPHTRNHAGRNVLECADDSSKKFPFAAVILCHMEENIKSRDPAVIRARQIEEAKREMCDAIHGGLSEAISVRPLKLLPSAKP